MKTFAYLRVSTDKQTVEQQLNTINEYVRSKGITIDEMVADEGISGGVSYKQRSLITLVSEMQAGDALIVSEISRLGRDLYMVMDILHHCMEVGAVIYTVKDHFVLVDDIQSKVLAFAFGLSAEIERQMIRQRTKEGLRMRMKMGILLGRPIGSATSEEAMKFSEWKDRVGQMVAWQMSPRQIADVIGCDRNTVNRLVYKWGYGEAWKYKTHEDKKTKERVNKNRMPTYKDGPYKIVFLDRAKCLELIEKDYTLPQIAKAFPAYTYEQVYDTILCDREFNSEYRKHAQKRLVKKR